MLTGLNVQSGVPAHPPGNSDGYQNKGDAKKATRKSLTTKDLQIDSRCKHKTVAEEGRDETGTRQQILGLEITASVTICQVRN